MKKFPIVSWLPLFKRVVHILLWIALLIPLVVVAYWAIWVNNAPEWTGFGQYLNSRGELERAKTLWDWMELLIVPVVLAIGVYLLNFVQKKTDHEIAAKARETERNIAQHRQQETIRDAYYDRMADLLLNHNLRETQEAGEKQSIANARTLSAIQSLDAQRKGQLLSFLYESGLIDREKPIIRLSGVNLSGIILTNITVSQIKPRWFVALGTGSNLSQANLSGAILNEAILSSVDLREADLSGSFLINAVMTYANLSNTNLHKADLRQANLSGAILREANLSDANLSGVDLTGADLKNVNLSGATLAGIKITDKQLATAFRQLRNPEVA